MVNLRICREHAALVRTALCKHRLGVLLRDEPATSTPLRPPTDCDPMTLAIGHLLIQMATTPKDLAQAAAVSRGCCAICCLDGRHGFSAAAVTAEAADWACETYLSHIPPGGTA
jgi:hypothetical protein